MSAVLRISYPNRADVPQAAGDGEMFFTSDTHELFSADGNGRVVPVRVGMAAQGPPKPISVLSTGLPADSSPDQVYVASDTGGGYVGKGPGRGVSPL